MIDVNPNDEIVNESELTENDKLRGNRGMESMIDTRTSIDGLSTSDLEEK